MRRYIVILLLAIPFAVFAQTAQQADQSFKAGEYDKALTQYKALLKKQPANQLYLYRYARCAYELGDSQTAIDYFVKAGTRYALRNYYLGELYFANYQFEEAIAAYNDYLKAGTPEADRKAQIEKNIALAQKGARYIKRVEDIQVIDSVNVSKQTFLSAYKLSPEAGTLSKSGDQFFFTNQRQDRRLMGIKTDDGISLMQSERLLDSWSELEPLPQNVNFGKRQNYPFCLSDGVTVYFASDSEDGLGGYDIYITQYDADNRTYRSPENLGFPFNSFANDYMLAIDETANRGYFATDRCAPEGMVTVYTFIPNQETKIVRGTAAELAAAATLHQSAAKTEPIAVAVEEPKQEVKQEPKQEVKQEPKPVVKAEPKQEQKPTNQMMEIRLVLNDTIVLTAMDQFRSAEAKENYTQYLQNKQTLTTAEQNLEHLRQNYSAAEEAEKEQMVSEIISLEQSIPQQRKALENLLKQIKQSELSARQ